MPKVFIIAEAGVNHNGSLKIAKEMVDVAQKAGADAVKFQTFRAEALVSMSAPKAGYQKRATAKNETQFQMLKKLELSESAHRLLIAYCKKKRIMFLSTPFDCQSIEFLDKLKIPIFKIPSGEITNLPYLRKIGNLRRKIILSTGMATLGEIGKALQILVDSGTKKDDIMVLHCNTEYPTPFEDVNLRAMLTIRDKFKVKVGYSDHTLGVEIPIAAVVLGASVIEKHFTLDKNWAGPDHRASLDPQELKAMVRSIKNIESALGNGIKKPSKSEIKNITIARKSIVASRKIKKNEKFTDINITTKRPGTGLSPLFWDKMIGKTAKRNYNEDEMISLLG